MVTNALLDLIKKEDYKTIYATICPEATSQLSCKAFYDRLYRDQFKGTGQPTVTPLDKQQLHVNYEYPGGFFLKTFTPPEDYYLSYAVQEVNLGLKVRDSITANGIKNLAPIEYCCTQPVKSGFDTLRQFFLASPLYPLGSLRTFMADPARGPLTSSVLWKLAMAAGILNGLKTLHSRNFAHRDIKPDNVLMGTVWDPLLTDYGFSKKIEVESDTIGGTPIFMAPEVRDGKSYTIQVDLWNTGALLFFLGVPKPYVWTAKWRETAVKGCDGVDLSSDKLPADLDFFCRGFYPLVRKMLDENDKQRGTAEEAYRQIGDIMVGYLASSKANWESLAAQATEFALPENCDWRNIVATGYGFAAKKLAEIGRASTSKAIELVREIHPEWFEKDGAVLEKHRSAAEAFYNWAVSAPAIPQGFVQKRLSI